MEVFVCLGARFVVCAPLIVPVVLGSPKNGWVARLRIVAKDDPDPSIHTYCECDVKAGFSGARDIFNGGDVVGLGPT